MGAHYTRKNTVDADFPRVYTGLKNNWRTTFWNRTVIFKFWPSKKWRWCVKNFFICSSQNQNKSPKPSMRRAKYAKTNFVNDFSLLSFFYPFLFCQFSLYLRQTAPFWRLFLDAASETAISERLLCDIWRLWHVTSEDFLCHSFSFHNSLFSLFRFFFISDCRIIFSFFLLMSSSLNFQ